MKKQKGCAGELSEKEAAMLSEKRDWFWRQKVPGDW